MFVRRPDKSVSPLRAAGDSTREAPAGAAAWIARARALGSRGRHREACDAWSKAKRAGAANAELDIEFALACFDAGRLADADRVLSAAIAAAPGSWRPWFERGRILQAMGRFREALQLFERALALCPDHVHSLNNAGICHLHLGDPAVAEAAFRRCVEIDPQDARMWVNLSASCAAQGRPDEALEAVRRAGSISANRDEAPELFCQTAIYLTELGRATEATVLLERNLAQRPDPNAHYFYSHLLLRSGRLAEGWRQQEFRWMLEPLASLRGRIHVPVWRGHDLRGRSILIRPEQGLGDTLHVHSLRRVHQGARRHGAAAIVAGTERNRRQHSRHRRRDSAR